MVIGVTAPRDIRYLGTRDPGARVLGGVVGWDSDWDEGGAWQGREGRGAWTFVAEMRRWSDVSGIGLD